MINDIILIFILCFSYGYWFNAQKLKELAFASAKRQCEFMEVQMLDDYVALNKLSLKRNYTGKFQLQRTFIFEFSSTGNERYQGRVEMLGRQVKSIYMDPYRIQ